MASGKNSRGSIKRPRKSYKPKITKLAKERATKRREEEAQFKKMFKVNKKKILDSECVICLNAPGNKQILSCGHIICHTCYNHLCINNISKCPMCRKKEICINNSYLLNDQTTFNDLTQNPFGLYLFGKCEQFLN